MELVSLMESTKRLKTEVQTKTNSISALEHLLKASSKARSVRNHKKTRQDNQISDGDSYDGTTSAESGSYRRRSEKSAIIRFFVTGPDGLCAEFNEKRTSSVLHLVNEVKRIFTPQFSDNDMLSHVRLVYQGKIMQEESTLEGCNLRDDDTVVAFFDQFQNSKTKTVRNVDVKMTSLFTGEDNISNKSEKTSPVNMGGTIATPKSTSDVAVTSETTTSSLINPDVTTLILKQQEMMTEVAQEMK